MYYNNKDVRLEEFPTPEIGAEELLVKVMACGICGSDVMEWYRIKKAPIVLGHEATGIVEKVGANIKNYKKGDRVFVSHHVPCNTCKYCLEGKHTVCNTLRATNFYPGGFSEYIQVPAINVQYGVYKLPEEISFEEGTFIEPLGCVVRAQKVANIKSGYTVLVIGSGISGILHVQLARALRATNVIAADINEYRLKAAQKLGASAVIQADESLEKHVCKLNNNRLADVVIVATGAEQAIAQALKCVDKGGILLFFAPTAFESSIELNLNDIFFKCLTILTSYAAAPQDIIVAMDLIRTRRINVSEMITHKLALAETSLGFELVAKAQNSIKVIIEPQR